MLKRLREQSLDAGRPQPKMAGAQARVEMSEEALSCHVT